MDDYGLDEVTAMSLSIALGNAHAELRKDVEAGKVDMADVMDTVDTLTETVQTLLGTVAELTPLARKAVH